MSLQNAGTPLTAKRDLFDTVFQEDEIGCVFVNAFRWLLRSRDYLNVILTDSRAKFEGVEEAQLLRGSDAYKFTREEVAGWLNPFPACQKDQLLDLELLIEARDAFWLRLRRAASSTDIAATVLGLLDAIEFRLGSRLLEAFREQRSPLSQIAIPVLPSRILPKPLLGFGTGIVSPERFPPPVDLPDEAIVLGEYFGRLAVTPSEIPQSPVPALHVHSVSTHVCREEPEWRVAMLSILADLDDVDWLADGGRFRGTALRNARIHVRLEWALEHCAKFQPDIIVIPELNIDQDCKAIIERWLRESPRGPDQTTPLVIYGALHFPDPEEEGSYRNQPGLLTPAREFQWDYWKRYGVRGKLKKDGPRVDENLGAFPPHVLAIDLPVGRIAVLICKDFLMETTRRAIQQLQPSVLVVPAMTSWGSVQDFRSYARTFASSLRCVTIFCNSSVYQRSPWRASDAQSARTLGVIQINTQIRSDKVPSHVLDREETRAVVGMYTLTATERDLEFRKAEEYLSPGEEDARTALRGL